MIKMSIHNVPFYRFTGLGSYYKLVHFVSCRVGGVSFGEQAALNLGFMEEDLPENVLTNRKLLMAEVGVDLSKLTIGEQRHTTNVAVITEEFIGRGGKDKATRLPETDALITSIPGVCLMVLAADCVPILLYDTEKRVIAAVHAGWKGTVGKIVVKVVEKMREVFNSSPRDLRAGIGPSIGKCCFEVGEEVIEAAHENLGCLDGIVDGSENAGKYYFDLWEANRRQLVESGLSSGRIEVARICTKCNHDQFFSHRGDQGITGRFGAGLMIRNS